jgi:hypothetical protein
MPDLAGLHEFAQDLQRLFERRPGLLRRVHIHQSPEHVDAALRPMQLVEVDVIGAQAFQAGLDRGRDVAPIHAIDAAPDRGEAFVRADHLGRDDNPIAPASRLQPRADHALGHAEGFVLGRHRIGLGGVPEIDPVVDRVIHLAMGVGLGVLHAPGHGSQANDAHLEIAAA